MLFNVANLPYWIFLGMGVLLFTVVIVSGGGDDDLDADLDIDADADLEISEHPFDLDTDADGDFSAVQVLSWLGFGKAPLILLIATDLSLWGAFGWMLNVILGDLFGQIPSGFWGHLIFLGSLAIALFIGSLVARPIGKMLAAFGEDASSDRLIGCVGRVSSATIPSEKVGKIGQVDVIDAARNLVTIHAVLPAWATISPKHGAQVLVIDRYNDNYLVIAKDSLDEDRWLSNASRPQNLR